MSTCHATRLTTSAPPRGHKRFTVEEANASLVYIRRVVRDLVTEYRHLVETRRRMEQPGREDHREQLEAGYEKAMAKLSGLIDELHLVGVELVDFERGLIDFPSEHQGRPVYLCWEHGEPRVTGWRESRSGFDGLRDLAQLNPPVAA